MVVLRIIAATDPVPAGDGPTGPDVPWVLIVAAAALVVAGVAIRRPATRGPVIAVVSIIVGFVSAFVILIADAWANSTTGAGPTVVGQALAGASAAAGILIAGLVMWSQRDRARP